MTVTWYRMLPLSSFRGSGKARSSSDDDGYVTSSSALHSVGQPIENKEPTHVTPSMTSLSVKLKPATVGDVRGPGDTGNPRDVIIYTSDLSTQRQWRHQRRHSDDRKSFTDVTDDDEDSVAAGVSANSHLVSSRGSLPYRTLPSCSHHSRRHPPDHDPTSGRRAGGHFLSRDLPFLLRPPGPPLIVVRSLKTAAELMTEVRRRRTTTTMTKRPRSENLSKRHRRTQRHEDSPTTDENHRHLDRPPSSPPPRPRPLETTPDDTLPRDRQTLLSFAVDHFTTDSTDDDGVSLAGDHSVTASPSSVPSEPPALNMTAVSRTRTGAGPRKSKQPPSKWETTFLEMGPDSTQVTKLTSDSTSKTVAGRSQTVSFALGEEFPQQKPKQPPATGSDGSREGQPGSETLGPVGVKQGPSPQPPQKTKKNFIDIGWLNKSKKLFKTSKHW